MASVPFNNLITFTRGSNATVTGPTGLIQWAPHNLLLQSESFDNAYWTKLNTAITANNTTSPDGTTTADLLNQSVATSSYTQVQITTGTGTYTATAFAKAGTLSWFRLSIYDTAHHQAWFNLSTGVVGTQEAGVTASITSVGNGWYRCAVTYTTAAANPYWSAYLTNADTGVAQVGTGFLWGAQLELGSAATAYNSTTVKNLLGFSEAFDNAAWTKSNASIVTGAQANPVNGAFNAQKLMENTAAGVYHYARQQLTVAGTAQTFSIYVKAAERTRAVISITDLTTGDASVGVDLTNGTTFSSGLAVGSWTNISSSVLPVGNGWYRVSLTATRGAGTQSAPVVAPVIAAGSTTYTGDGNSGVYIYGAQLSDSASLDPYVPTPAAAPSSTAYYGPRFDYDPVTLQPKGLLVEEARTNFIIYSDDFGNAAWTKSDNTVTTNSVVSPDGSTNADTATPTGASPIVRQTYTTSTTGAYTGTIWLRSSTSTNVTISLRPTGAGSPVSVVCAVTSTWQRFTVNLTAAAGVTNIQFWIEQFSQAVNLYGAQLEAGAFATSYIPTVASTVTRSADVATINGSLFSQWYGQTEGSWVSSFAPYAVTGSVVAQISAATNNDRFQFLNDNTNQIAITAGGVGQGGIDAGTINPSATNNLSFAYRTNDTAASLNGGAMGTDTTVTLPVVDRLCLGATVAPAAFLNGHIRSIDYIPARAADFQLQALTL